MQIFELVMASLNPTRDPIFHHIILKISLTDSKNRIYRGDRRFRTSCQKQVGNQKIGTTLASLDADPELDSSLFRTPEADFQALLVGRILLRESQRIEDLSDENLHTPEYCTVVLKPRPFLIYVQR